MDIVYELGRRTAVPVSAQIRVVILAPESFASGGLSRKMALGRKRSCGGRHGCTFWGTSILALVVGGCMAVAPQRRTSAQQPVRGGPGRGPPLPLSRRGRFWIGAVTCQPATPHGRTFPRLWTSQAGRTPTHGARHREAARGLDAAGRGGPCDHLSPSRAGWRRKSTGRRRPIRSGRINAKSASQSHGIQQRVRDLFALDVDVASQLPGDETSDGADNLADVLSISTAHLERYLSVARQVTRLATGLPPKNVKVETFEIPRMWCKTIGRATICRSDPAAACGSLQLSVEGDDQGSSRRQYQDT